MANTEKPTAIVEKERDTGNFLLNFPNQSYRQWRRHNSRGLPPREIKLENDLDRLLEKTNFDLKKCLELEEKAMGNKMKAIEITQKNNGIITEEARGYHQIGVEYSNQVQEMLMPLYNKMLELGYTEHELAG